MPYVDYFYPLTERRLRARKRALVVDEDVLQIPVRSRIGSRRVHSGRPVVRS